MPFFKLQGKNYFDDKAQGRGKLMLPQLAAVSKLPWLSSELLGSWKLQKYRLHDGVRHSSAGKPTPTNVLVGAGLTALLNLLVESKLLGQAKANRSAHYLWAVLIAKIHEVFPLCGGQMRVVKLPTTKLNCQLPQSPAKP